VATTPLTVGSLDIFAGQRYSFVLTANQTISNYWIRADPNVGRNGFNGGINSAILRYVGAPVADPTSSQTSSPGLLLESNLRPLVPAPVPGQPRAGGVDLALTLDIERSSDLWSINGGRFVRPTVPVLLQLLSGARTAQELFPKGDVYVLPPNAVVEVLVKGGTHGPVSPLISQTASRANICVPPAPFPFARGMCFLYPLV
jgi:iron transport multicopper oxidase